MSGRIRSIKPEINDDESVASLSSDAWRLWISMWTLADDEGNLRASPRQLKAKVFWARDPMVAIEELLSELVQAKRVQLYEVAGESFAHLRNWKKHQKIDKPQDGKVPPPPSPTEDSSLTSRDSANVRGAVAEGSANEQRTFTVGREGRGREGIGEERSRTSAPPPPAPPVVITGGIAGNAVNHDGVVLPPEPAKKTSRGSRLPADWVPSESTVEWCHEQGVDPVGVLPEFLDHWAGVSGKSGVKLDWNGTFKNRVRDLIRWGRAPEWHPPPRAKPDEPVQELVPLSPQTLEAIQTLLKASGE